MQKKNVYKNETIYTDNVKKKQNILPASNEA